MRFRILFLVPALTLLIGNRSIAQSAEPPVVSDLILQNEFPNQVIMGTISAINDPMNWSDLAFLSYTPGFGALPTAPGKHFDPMWDATTQKFSWNTFASSDGTYVWLVTATNAAGDDQGQIMVELRTPEPAQRHSPAPQSSARRLSFAAAEPPNKKPPAGPGVDSFSLTANG